MLILQSRDRFGGARGRFDGYGNHRRDPYDHKREQVHHDSQAGCSGRVQAGDQLRDSL